MGRCKGSHWIGNQRIPQTYDFEREIGLMSVDEKNRIKKLLEEKKELTTNEKIILDLLKEKESEPYSIADDCWISKEEYDKLPDEEKWIWDRKKK